MTRALMESTINQIVADSTVVTPTDVANLTRNRTFCCNKPGAGAALGDGDDAAAGTDITNVVLWSNDTGGTVTLTGISFRPGNTGFTESTSVFATMTITKRTSAGATSTSVATATTNTVANGGLGTMTVGQTGAFTLTATTANLILAAGACLLYSKTHASTGTILPGGVITVSYTEN